MRDHAMITPDEEHDFQFSSRKRADLFARLETIKTKRRHQIFLTTTYRNLQPRTAWVVVLALCWKNGTMQTNEEA